MQDVYRECPKIKNDRFLLRLVSENDVNAMLALAKSEAPRIASTYIKNDVVEVIDGPFQGFDGVVDEVIPEKEKVRVIVSIFGRQTPIELDYLQVKRKDK